MNRQPNASADRLAIKSTMAMKALRKMFMMNPLLAKGGKLFFVEVELIDQEIELSQSDSVLMHYHVKQVLDFLVFEVLPTDVLQQRAVGCLLLIAQGGYYLQCEIHLSPCITGNDLLEVIDIECHGFT